MNIVLLILSIAFIVAYLVWFLLGKNRWSKMITSTVDVVLILFCIGTLMTVSVLKNQLLTIDSQPEEGIEENSGSDSELPAVSDSDNLQDVSTDKENATPKVEKEDAGVNASPVSGESAKPEITPEDAENAETTQGSPANTEIAPKGTGEADMETTPEGTEAANKETTPESAGSADTETVPGMEEADQMQPAAGSEATAAPEPISEESPQSEADSQLGETMNEAVDNNT